MEQITITPLNKTEIIEEIINEAATIKRTARKIINFEAEEPVEVIEVDYHEKPIGAQRWTKVRTGEVTRILEQWYQKAQKE